jgi:WD40 repeat protein
LFTFPADDVEARAVAFSPDGRLLATGARDGTITLWDLRTGERSGAPLQGPAGRVNSIDFSPDGRVLASAAIDGTVVLWDIASRRQIGAGLPVALSLSGPVSYGPAVRFSPDGSSLVAIVDSGQASLWTVDPEQWRTRACAIASRDLTRDEWLELVGDRPYEPIC